MKKTFWSKTVLTLCLAAMLLLPAFLTLKTQAAAQPLVDQTHNFVSGREYVLASASSITDDKNVKIDHCAVLAVPVAKSGSTVLDSLDYADMPESNPSDKFLWKITDEGNGKYALYSVSQKKYMKLVDGQILLTAEKSTVNGVISGGEAYFMNDDGEYLRFTNVDRSRFHCNSLNARKLKLFATMQLPGEYEESEEPLLSVACFSDMHHEYGIQYWNPPYRNSTKTAVDYIKNSLGKVDVLLIGGDITGRRNNSAGNNLVWTGGSSIINNFQKKNYELFQAATKTGAVMVVTGNHDPEPSVHMNGGYPSANSNDWSSYMKKGVGNFEASVTYSDLNLSTAGVPTQYQNEVLGYRYTVNGIPFIGLCTPFGDRRSVGQTGHNGLYLAQVEWLEDQLTAIGKDKTVVVFCHYPITSMPMINNGGATQKAVLSNSDAQNKMKSVLSQFPNVIYTYGHIHGDNSRIAKYTTSELVFPTGSSSQQSDNSYRTSGWISAFMGSLGFYGNSHQSSLSDAELKVVQFLVMNFYEDHITFQYYNTGSLYAPEGAQELTSYTVRRDLSAQLDSGSDNTDSSVGTSSSSASTSSSVKTSSASASNSQDTGTPSDTDTPVDTDLPSDETGTETGTSSDESGTDGTVTDPDDSSDTTASGTETEPSPDSTGTAPETNGTTSSEDGESISPVLFWSIIGGSALIVLSGAGFCSWYLIRGKKGK